MVRAPATELQSKVLSNSTLKMDIHVPLLVKGTLGETVSSVGHLCFNIRWPALYLCRFCAYCVNTDYQQTFYIHLHIVYNLHIFYSGLDTQSHVICRAYQHFIINFTLFVGEKKIFISVAFVLKLF